MWCSRFCIELALHIVQRNVTMIHDIFVVIEIGPRVKMRGLNLPLSPFLKISLRTAPLIIISETNLANYFWNDMFWHEAERFYEQLAHRFSPNSHFGLEPKRSRNWAGIEREQSMKMLRSGFLSLRIVLSPYILHYTHLPRFQTTQIRYRPPHY